MIGSYKELKVGDKIRRSVKVTASAFDRTGKLFNVIETVNKVLKNSFFTESGEYSRKTGNGIKGNMNSAHIIPKSRDELTGPFHSAKDYEWQTTDQTAEMNACIKAMDKVRTLINATSGLSIKSVIGKNGYLETIKKADAAIEIIRSMVSGDVDG